MKKLIDTPQFDQDVNWCIEELKRHFVDIQYREETFVAHFTRGSTVNKRYWKNVNQEATKRLTNIPTSLLHKEAYRELNSMAFFAINIMVGTLLDCRYNGNLNKNALEEILQITHDALFIRDPHSLSGHDNALHNLQSCIDQYCHTIGAPSDEFANYSDKMNALRLKELQ